MCQYSKYCTRTGTECEGCESTPSAEMLLAGGIQNMEPDEVESLFEEILESEGLPSSLPDEAIESTEVITRFNLPIYQ